MINRARKEQINVRVRKETKEILDKLSEDFGLTRTYIIENSVATFYHMHADKLKRDENE